MRPGSLSVLLAGALVAGCATIDVTSDYDTAHDFSGYRTWDWRQDPNEGAPSSTTRNSLIDRRVRPAVERHLAVRGFERAASGSPDFHVAYQVGVQGKLHISTWDHGYRRRGWGGGTTTHVTQYDEGSLVIAVIDAETQEMVWQGSAHAIVDRHDSPEEREARIDEAVRLILERFPPTPR